MKDLGVSRGCTACINSLCRLPATRGIMDGMVVTDAASLKAQVARYARELGFDQVRIASAEPFIQQGRVAEERVRRGYMDGMPWYTEERVRKASDPQALLPGARSFIAVALSYLPPEEEGKHLLREIYYRQRNARARSGHYLDDLEELGITQRTLNHFVWPPTLQATDYGYEAWIQEAADLNDDGHISRWVLTEDSHVRPVRAPE